MTELHVDIAIGDKGRTRDELAEIAIAAEDAGVENLWLTEGRGRDVFSVLTSLAQATKRIGLGTGIVNVYSRSPATLAQSTASVMELMPGRTFNLGLGASGKGIIEKFHGMPFERPASRVRETIRVIDELFTTGRTPASNDMFLTSGVPATMPMDRANLRILVAGLGGMTLKVTGELADGWLPIWPSKTRSMEALGAVRAAAEAAGRPAPNVAAYIYGVVSDDPRLIQLVRGTLAWYVAANGTAYHGLFERYGYTKELAEITGLWNAGKRDEAREVVDQAMLEDTALFGTREQFMHSLQAFRDAGVDQPILRLPEGLTVEETVAMLSSLRG